ARGDHRPHRLRRQLERTEPERRRLSGERRHAHRRAGARQAGGLTVKILAVSGSLRADSYNTRLLHLAADIAPEGVDVELWEGLGDLPIYDQDLDGPDAPTSVMRLREEWGSADAILFATPEYNGSIPGGLKNAIDWASRPVRESALTNQDVAVIGS